MDQSEESGLACKETNHSEETEKEKIKKKNDEYEKIIVMDPSKRSELSIEGGKGPLSLYTRRVIDTSKLSKVLNSNSSHGICGGRNLGNTCFMNSSIACLQNCTELTTYFLLKEFSKDINKENRLGLKGNLADAWYELLNEYWIENNSCGTPSNFKSVMGSRATIFRGYGQQDSNEFMSYFLDFMNEELNGTTKKPYSEVPEKQEKETDLECSKRFWENNLRRNDSIITDLFCGQFKCTVKCPECGWVSVTFDPFNTINLPIVDKSNDSGIEEKEFFYVINYGFKSPLKLNFRVSSETTIDQFIEEMREEYKDGDENFFKSINSYNFCLVNEKVLSKYLSTNKTFDDAKGSERGTIFAFNSLINDSKADLVSVPIYFKIKDAKFSEYPRLLTLYNDMTFEELKIQIYKYTRKFLLGPYKTVTADQAKSKDNDDQVNDDYEEYDQISRELIKFSLGNSYDTRPLEELIEKEYHMIFDENAINNKDKNENLKKYLENLPFNVYVSKNTDIEDGILLFSKENLVNPSKEFSQLTGINKNKDKIKDFISLIKDKKGVISNNNDKGEYNIILEIDYETDFLNRKLKGMNTCKTIQVKQSEKLKQSLNANLFDCLTQFTKNEKLREGNEWYCKKCKKSTLAIKKMELYYLPKILIICFKRFSKESSYRWEKNDEDVNFPVNNADFKDFVVGPDSSHSVYDLFAVSQHYGGTWGGHYTAMAKNLGKKWYSYNDSSCHESDEGSLQSSAAYVLFYRRQTD